MPETDERVSKIIWNENASVEDNIKSKMQVPIIAQSEKYKHRKTITHGDEGGGRGRALVFSPKHGETNSDKPIVINRQGRA